MILEAEKFKNILLTSAEGFCTQSFHCGKWVSGEQERDTGFGQVSPNTYAEGLGPSKTLLSRSLVRGNLGHLMRVLKGTLRPKPLPLGTLLLLPCVFTMMHPSPKAQSQGGKLSTNRKFRKKFFITLNIWSPAGGPLWESMELYRTWVQNDKYWTTEASLRLTVSPSLGLSYLFLG